MYATPNDPRSLAEALVTLEADPERRAAMGEAGRRRVQESLAWRHSVPHLLTAYERLAPEPASVGRIASPRDRATTDLDA